MLYKYNFRFNAKHHLKKDKSDEHVHTFDICITLIIKEELVISTEKQIKQYLQKFQGCSLNKYIDFPIIENVCEYIYEELEQQGLEIKEIEISDKPTQSFIMMIERKERA